ncbi:MAG: hypothetical protein ACKVJ1_03715 [Verrucomicrobiia bacterium]|jgi:hypothetical protein
MNIPQRLLEEGFWELENDLNEEVFKDCKEIATNHEQARQLYINVRAMHFMLLEKKQRLEESHEIKRTEEIWDQMKKDDREKNLDPSK